MRELNVDFAQNFQEGNNLTHTWSNCIQPGVQRLALFLLSHREKLETAEWALWLPGDCRNLCGGRVKGWDECQELRREWWNQAPGIAARTTLPRSSTIFQDLRSYMGEEEWWDEKHLGAWGARDLSSHIPLSGVWLTPPIMQILYQYWNILGPHPWKAQYQGVLPQRPGQVQGRALAQRLCKGGISWYQNQILVWTEHAQVLLIAF